MARPWEFLLVSLAASLLAQGIPLGLGLALVLHCHSADLVVMLLLMKLSCSFELVVALVLHYHPGEAARFVDLEPRRYHASDHWIHFVYQLGWGAW